MDPPLKFYGNAAMVFLTAAIAGTGFRLGAALMSELLGLFKLSDAKSRVTIHNWPAVQSVCTRERK